MNYNEYFTSKEFTDITSAYSTSTRDLVNKEITSMYSERKRLILTAVMTCDEATVAEVLQLSHQCIFDMAPEDANIHHLIGIIRGLHEYPQYKTTQLTTLMDHKALRQDPTLWEDFNKITALINITSMLHREFENPPLHVQNPDEPNASKIWLKPELADLVLKHHELITNSLSLYAKGGHEVAYGITHLEWFKKQDINNVTDQTVETLYNYFRVTSAIIDHAKWENIAEDSPKALWLNNPPLEAFIENHPEHIDDLTTYIKERGTTDLQGFDEYMSHAQPLRVGAL